MALAPQLSKEKGIVEDLLFYLVADNDTRQYVIGFDRLTAWVDNSLDAYQVLIALQLSLLLQGSIFAVTAQLQGSPHSPSIQPQLPPTVLRAAGRAVAAPVPSVHSLLPAPR